MTEVIVYCKGSAKPFNPGAGAWAFVVYRDGVKIAERRGVYKDPCYNWEAEYYAIWQALQWLVIKGFNFLKIVVKLDCGLVVRQLQAKARVEQVARYMPYRRAYSLIKRFPSLRFEKIEKWENEADALAQQAYEEYCRRRGKPLNPYKKLYREVLERIWDARRRVFEESG
ncbi:MAG: reverse transcriptase-like protein [Candidatus Bathyarchaeia archaeon]